MERSIRYLYLGSRLIARVHKTGNELVTQYVHTDTLGSKVAESDSTGSVFKRSRYAPYGESLDAFPSMGPGFTGHYMDRAGLIYMQQRYYDPKLARFLSPDPIGSSPTNFNRYWYAHNNPYKFVDPDGRDIKCTNDTCQLVPIGGTFPIVNFPRPKGFPASISEKDSTFHHVYRFTDSAGNGDAAYSQRLNNQLVNNPTPIQDKPATLVGNKIDVNANNAISRLTGQDNVMSYKVPLQDGASAVLNVTTGDHAAAWGVVLRMIQSDRKGAQNIVTYGEGNSFLQRAFDPKNKQSKKVWSQSAEEIVQKAQQP